MKKLVFLSLLMAGAISSWASHLMGGEITARQIAPLTYEVTLTNYLDTLGIPAYPNVNFILRDSNNVQIGSSLAPFDTALSGSLLPGYPYGVRVYVYRDTLVLPSTGTYTVSVSDCCRNAAIQNMASPSGESLYLETTVTAFSGSNNSTPVFLAMPVVYLPAFLLWQYNPLPFDADGDSLVWSVDTPLTAQSMAVAGYAMPPFVTGGTSYNIDPATGTVSWTPASMGNFVTSIKVEEYRGGVKIGEIRRDMQMIVVAPANKPPHVSNINSIAPANGSGQHILSLTANTPVQFTLLAEDEDAADVVRMEAIGEQFTGADAATFTTSLTGLGNQVAGVFSWTPSAARGRDLPYITVFRAKDAQFAFDETILFYVNKVVSVDAASNLSQATVYPNPAKNTLTLSFDLRQAETLKIAMYDLTGNRVMAQENLLFGAGKQLITMPVSVESGMYLLTIENEHGVLSTQRVAIIK